MFIKKLRQQVICNHHEPVAHTPLGDLRGVKTEDAYIFRGIQYATARRFHRPEPEQPWEGIRDAIIYGFVCPEITTPVPHDQFTVPHVFYPQQENCQYLNVWTQSLDPLPWFRLTMMKTMPALLLDSMLVLSGIIMLV